MKVAVVSPETDNMSKTDLALGILRDMMAAGLGKVFGTSLLIYANVFQKHMMKRFHV